MSAITRLARIRKLAERLRDWDQEWARKSHNERHGLCLAWGAQEASGWKALDDDVAHWLASHLTEPRKK